MAPQLSSILHKATSNPKQLFLIDALGALLTACLLATIVARFEAVFGMPEKTVRLLSLIAFTYAIYSGCCYFTVKNWRPFLKAIAIANFMYRTITIGLLFFYYHRLTALGLAYFLVELVVIGILLFVELTAVARR